jgi:hypothetical protein
VLPFVFIFNPQMLLIGVETWADTIVVVVVSFGAVLLFSAATMGYFAARSRLWESALLLVACFALFRPDFFLNYVAPQYQELPAREFLAQVAQAPEDRRIAFVVEGVSIEGEDVRKTITLPLGAPRATPQERLREAGLTVSGAGDQLTITNVGFGSYAKRTGLEAGYKIVQVLLPSPDRPSPFWVYLPAFALAGLVWLLQSRRSRAAGPLARSQTPSGVAPAAG